MTTALLGLALLALSTLDIGASIAVVRLHAAVLRRGPAGSGLLSWHVVTVASGNIAKVSGISLALLDMLDIVESPLLLWLALVAAGELLTLAALVIIGWGQYARVRREDARIRVTPDPDPPARHRLRGPAPRRGEP